MTTEEMFQMLMNEVKEMRSGLNRLEAKVDANHAEVKADIARLEAKIDANHADTTDKLIAIKLVTIHIDTDLGQVTKEFKSYRHFTQGAIHDIQLRQEILENDVENIKLKLDKAS